jgi:hypothetical protein
MNRKPLDQIRININRVMPSLEYPNWIDLVTPHGRIGVPLSDAPALIAALATLSREMGVDVPDPVPVIEGIVAAYDEGTHMMRKANMHRADCTALWSKLTK